MKDFIHSHKFSELDNGDNIIYTRGEFSNILHCFNRIQYLNKNVILITANSDFSVDDSIVSQLPKNVHRWYAQNGFSENEKLIIIPEGLQPSFPSKSGDMGYEIAIEKERILSNFSDITPTKLVYANFASGTNPKVRNEVQKICEDTEFIDWDGSIDFSDYTKYNNPNSLNYFYNKILEYQSVVCPVGNGIDTHRVYETLYLNRIPITFNKIIYKKLYFNYPVILLNSYEELTNQTVIEEKIKEISNKKFDKNLLYFDYWRHLIMDDFKTMISK